MPKGFTAKYDRYGNVIQSGVDTPTPIPEALSGWPLGDLTEAVVLQIYYPEEDSRKATGKQTCIQCDVRTIGYQSQFLPRVRVLQPAHGLFDEDIWIPRPSTQAIDGSNLVSIPSGTTGAGSKLTRAELLDGSHVIIAFLDNSTAKPVILPFGSPHPNARNLLQKSNGRVRRIRHSGTLAEWSSKGDWTLDATGAAKAELGSLGTEQSATGDGGTITVKTKDGTGAESSMVLDNSGGIKILDGAGDYVELTKASQRVKLLGKSTVDIDAPTVTIDGSTSISLNTSTGTVSISAGSTSASFSTTGIVANASAITANSTSITLGLTLPTFLTKHTTWAAAWSDLASALATQIPQYQDPNKSQVAVADYKALIEKIAAVSAAFVLSATTITKAG